MFFTQEELDQLLENGRTSRSSDGGVDHWPVAKLFTLDANCTWLLTELSPDDHTIAFGLCDLGLGIPGPRDMCRTGRAYRSFKSLGVGRRLIWCCVMRI